MSDKTEAKIRQEIKQFLTLRGWLVEITHGNAFQFGFPDLYLAHPKWGTRWVDVKRPAKYSLTKAQRLKWPIWEQYNIGIWILTAANDEQYLRLFGPPNWRDYA
jgi:hypothetical protein